MKQTTPALPAEHLAMFADMLRETAPLMLAAHLVKQIGGKPDWQLVEQLVDAMVTDDMIDWQVNHIAKLYPVLVERFDPEDRELTDTEETVLTYMTLIGAMMHEFLDHHLTVMRDDGSIPDEIKALLEKHAVKIESSRTH